MEKDFVPYELAVKLKPIGFDEPCFGYYDLDGLQVNTHHWYPQNKNSSFPLPHTTNNPKISAPTFSQAFRWFREKYYLHPHIFSKEGGAFIWCIRWYADGLQKDIPYELSNTYEEAELACLTKLIEIVETKSE